MRLAAALGVIDLLASGCAARPVPDATYEFLSVADEYCFAKVGVPLDAAHRAECARLTAPRRYRGIWDVEFEGSVFTPAGNPCVEGMTAGYCAYIRLEGRALPRIPRWSCARKYEVDFIGRRSARPSLHNSFDFRLVVDRMISAKRLPDPYDENCDPKLHPEIEAKRDQHF